MLVGKLEILKKVKLIRTGRSGSFYAFLSFVFFVFIATPTWAQNVNGCDNYTPTTGQTVNCNNTFAASTSGVQTPQNNTGNNNVTVDINATAQRSINGSTVGIGSASTVTNAGILNTQSFFYGYGISFGANGRSKAGGNTVTNSGTITTGGTSADAIHVESTNATSAPDSITNTGTLTTTGSSANGIWTSSTQSAVTINNNGGTITTSGQNADAVYAKNTGNTVSLTNTATGKISATGANSNAVSVYGAASITNSGTICAGTISGGICQAPSSGGNAILLNNTYNSTRSTITNQAGGVISSPSTTAIQSLQPGVDIYNSGTINSPTNAVVFANTSTAVTNSLTLYAGSTTTGALQFNTNSTGETLTFSGLNNANFSNSITGLNTINAIAGANVNMSSASGYSLVNGTVNVSGVSLLEISGAITDQGGVSSITKTGSDTLRLSGANTYTGATNINAGTLKAGAANSFSGSSAHSVAAGAVIDLDNLNQTVGSLAGAGTVTLGSGALTTGGNNSSTSFSGVMSGTGSLTKVGSGTFTMSGANTYNGPTAVNSGVLNITGSLVSNTTVSSSASLTNSGTISGAINNSGYVLNSATGSFTAAVTNNASGTIDNYGQMSGGVTNSGTLNLNGGISLTGAITNNGQTNLNATQTLDNANFINNGTLSAASSATNLTLTGTGIYSQASGANFITRIDGLTSGSYSQVISNQPINIASGAIITAVLNPALILNPGDVVPAVINGNGTPTSSGTITVDTISDRYKLLSRYAGPNGENVDLYLPGNTDGLLHEYNKPGTYYGALQEQTLATVAAIQVPTLGVLHQRYALLNVVAEYDCNKFDKYNFCISAQARATGFGTQATGAGVLNIAYRPIPQVHVGAFIDYQAAAGNPAANNSPIAVTLNNGGVQYGYDNPTFGGYAGFSQSGYSGNLINNGLQVMVSGAYNPGKVSVTRALIMNPYLPFVDAQPGSGNASLNSSIIRGMVGYGIALTDRATLMPYGGIRFTDVTRGAYMENYTAIVTQPLAYNSFYERLLTGFGGAMLHGRLTDQFGAIIGLGLETDLTRYANSFSGYSPIAIEYMTNFTFDHGGSWNGLRPTANAGAYYDVAPNQRISLNGFAGQQAWTSRSYATGLLGYQIAF